MKWIENIGIYEIDRFKKCNVSVFILFENNVVRTFVAIKCFLDINDQFMAISGSKPFSFAYFSKNFLLFSFSCHMTGREKNAKKKEIKREQEKNKE
jgi:hypothetical protein